MLDVSLVVTTHDEIIAEFGGLPGYADAGRGGVEAALLRVANRTHYAGLNDILGIAGLYAEALARGHVFNDGNKRTALACSLAYLELEGIRVRRDPILEEAIVHLAKHEWNYEDFAWLLGLLAGVEMYGDRP